MTGPFSSDTPQAVDGTAAAAGTGVEVPRQDHVHALGPLVATLDASGQVIDAISRAVFNSDGPGTTNGGIGYDGTNPVARVGGATVPLSYGIWRFLSALNVSTNSTSSVSLMSGTARTLVDGDGAEYDISVSKVGTAGGATVRGHVGGTNGLLISILSANTNLHAAQVSMMRQGANCEWWGLVVDNSGTSDAFFASVGVDPSGATVGIYGDVFNPADVLHLNNGFAKEIVA